MSSERRCNRSETRVYVRLKLCVSIRNRLQSHPRPIVRRCVHLYGLPSCPMGAKPATLRVQALGRDEPLIRDSPIAPKHILRRTQ